MKNKLFQLVTVIMVVAFSLFTLVACDNAEEQNVPDTPPAQNVLAYTLINDGSEYEVSGLGTCTDTNVIIPATHNGKPVTSIGERAFYTCKNLSSINIGSNVKSIGPSAFYNCSNLLTATFGSALESIGSAAFRGCNGLTEINIGSNVESIGKGAFYSCDSLASIEVAQANEYYQSIEGNLYSKDGKTLIQYAIGKAYERKDEKGNIVQKSPISFSIPDGVTEIGYGAFAECTNLTVIEIPKSVTKIGEHAFYACNSAATVLEQNIEIVLDNKAITVTYPQIENDKKEIIVEKETVEFATTVFYKVREIKYDDFIFKAQDEETAVKYRGSVIKYQGFSRDWENIVKDLHWDSNLTTETHWWDKLEQEYKKKNEPIKPEKKNFSSTALYNEAMKKYEEKYKQFETAYSNFSTKCKNIKSMLDIICNDVVVIQSK